MLSMEDSQAHLNNTNSVFACIPLTYFPSSQQNIFKKLKMPPYFATLKSYTFCNEC